MSLFHSHKFDKIKSVQRIEPSIGGIDNFHVSTEIAKRILDKMEPRTSVVKECECGALEEYLFTGDHTKEFRHEKESQDAEGGGNPQGQGL
jgi:hypothetical protein